MAVNMKVFISYMFQLAQFTPICQTDKFAIIKTRQDNNEIEIVILKTQFT